MKMDRELCKELGSVLFRNQRIEALISCIRILFEGSGVEIIGLPDNALSYSLYEIESIVCENNKKLEDLVRKSSFIKPEERQVQHHEPLN